MRQDRHLPGPTPARVAFHRGSRLVRGDLEEIRDTEVRLLGLHVRGAHGWGVASGLTVELMAGGREVRVGAGVAFDCHGTPLHLSAPTTVGAPPAPPGAARPSPFDLIIEGVDGTSTDSASRFGRLAWRGTALAPASSNHEAECGEPRRSAVPLARFRRHPGGTLQRIDRSSRPLLRPSSRPFLARDSIPGSTLGWTATRFDVRAWVDTRAAGFGSTPTYVATLAEWPSAWQTPFLRLDAETSDGFQIRLLPSAPVSTAAALEDLVTRAGDARITWIGAERHRDCVATRTDARPPLELTVLPVELDVVLVTYFGGDE